MVNLRFVFKQPLFSHERVPNRHWYNNISITAVEEICSQCVSDALTGAIVCTLDGWCKTIFIFLCSCCSLFVILFRRKMPLSSTNSKFVHYSFKLLHTPSLRTRKTLRNLHRLLWCLLSIRHLNICWSCNLNVGSKTYAPILLIRVMCPRVNELCRKIFRRRVMREV